MFLYIFCFISIWSQWNFAHSKTAMCYVQIFIVIIWIAYVIVVVILLWNLDFDQNSIVGWTTWGQVQWTLHVWNCFEEPYIWVYFYEIYSWGRTQNMLILHGQSCYYRLPGDARNHGILRIDLVCWEYSIPCTQRVNSHYMIIVRDWPFSKLLSVCVREDQHSKIQTYHEISRDLLAWSWL